MKIRFTETKTVEAQGEIVQTFNAGEVYELSVASANRWLRRNCAVEVQGAVTSEPTKSTDTAEKPVRKKRKYTRRKPITSAKSAQKPDDSADSKRAKSDTGTGQSDEAPADDSDK